MLHATANIHVRFADCDAMGHVNNATYLTFMEQARMALFNKVDAAMGRSRLSVHSFPFIIAEITCRYLKPIEMDSRLQVTATVDEIKNSSFVIAYEMKHGEELVATGRSVQVWYDYGQKKSRPIPEEVRNLLQK